MREQRKVVTVLFADIVGSTELASQRDPELVRSLMSRYFRRIAEIAGAYGGTVEKFAGDAAMVVFGVPSVHDDDAERAVRAALEIRDHATAELEVRVGVNTGEAVTAAAEDRQFMVSGDMVNIAARLQQGAFAGEVLVGEVTHRLTKWAIEYAPHEPVTAKGKPKPIPAFRAVRALSQVPTQARGVPGIRAQLVGRDRELRLILDTFARTAEDRTSHLFTLVGAPGIGKSRLVDEALERLGETGARLLRGRCLPYGRGITYWPLIEMVQQHTGITVADDPQVALRKLERWLGELMVADAQRQAVQTRLAVMLGYASAESAMPDTPGDGVEKEIAWAVRRYLETLARSAPLIAVVDDVQWAEPPVVALIELLAERVADVPLLIVCVARPEFLEAGGWKSPKANSTTITLDPLSAQDTETLLSRLLEIEALPDQLRRQIVERSAGTPLFCEEYIHMLIDEGVVVREGSTWRASTSIGQIEVPYEINAVLAARLDLLAEEERQLLQAASVIGKRFSLRQLQFLVADEGLEPRLERLRRRGLLTGGDGPGEDYEFRHLLIRDAAYNSLPKSARGDLHDRFARVLEESGDPDLIVEILAYHADRAFAMSHELALDPEIIAARAERSVRWLFVMADRARTRHDSKTLDAALISLREALAALGGQADEPRVRLRLLEAQAALNKGDYAAARVLANEAAGLAEVPGLWEVVARARLIEAWISTWTLAGSLEEYQRTADRAIEACRRVNDVAGEIEARHVKSFMHWSLGDARRFAEINEELLERAKAAGDVAHVAQLVVRLIAADQTLGRRDAARQHTREATELVEKYGFRNVALRVLMDTAGESSNRADFALAEEQWRKLASAAEDAGAKQFEISARRFLGYTLLYEGRPVEAAESLDRALQLSYATGERWNRTELFALRARAALEAGDTDAADELIGRARDSLRPGDLTAESEVNLHLGAIRMAQLRDAEAESALRRALDVVAPTDFLSVSAPAAFQLALLLANQGRTDEAAQLVRRYGDAVHERDWHIWDGLIGRYEQAITERSEA